MMFHLLQSLACLPVDQKAFLVLLDQLEFQKVLPLEGLGMLLVVAWKMLEECLVRGKARFLQE